MVDKTAEKDLEAFMDALFKSIKEIIHNVLLMHFENVKNDEDYKNQLTKIVSDYLKAKLAKYLEYSRSRIIQELKSKISILVEKKLSQLVFEVNFLAIINQAIKADQKQGPKQKSKMLSGVP